MEKCLISWIRALIQSVDRLIDWLVDWLIKWVSEWVINGTIDWLIDWLIDWVIDWLVYPWMDWLIDCIFRAGTISTASLSENFLSPPQHSYSAWTQYNNTKLFQIILSKYLQENWSKEGITFYALHPGNMILTGLSRTWWFWRLVFTLVRPFTKTLEQGAATTVYCAATPELASEGGKYWNNCWMSEPNRVVEDAGVGKALWDLCQDMLAKKIRDYQSRWDDPFCCSLILTALAMGVQSVLSYFSATRICVFLGTLLRQFWHVLTDLMIIHILEPPTRPTGKLHVLRGNAPKYCRSDFCPELLSLLFYQ